MRSNHVHAQLSGKRTRKAATYPSQLINAICKGIANHTKADKFDLNLIAEISQIHGHDLLSALKDYKENADKCHAPEVDFE